MGAFLMPSSARQRGEVVRDDNSQTNGLGYQDEEEAGMPRNGYRADDSGVFVGSGDGGLPQAKPGGSVRGRERSTNATSTRGSTVQVCAVDPSRRYKPVRPAWKTGLGVNLTVMAVEESLGQTTAPPRPRLVTAIAGSGNDTAPAGAHKDWVQKGPMTSPRRQTPAVPAKQADRVMESTVTTVRGSLGLAPLDPDPVATVAGKGGGAAAAGEQWSWVCRTVVATQRRHTPMFPAKQADRVMECTVTTVRGSLGLAPLDPGPVATAAGKGGGAAAAGAQQSWV